MVSITYEYYKDLKARQVALDSIATTVMSEMAWRTLRDAEQRDVLRIVEDRVKQLEGKTYVKPQSTIFNNNDPVPSPVVPAPSRDVPTGMEDAW